MYDEYIVSRSFRRGLTPEAKTQNVLAADIERKQRWREAETTGARKSRVSMSAHHTDVQLALKAFVRYSKAL